MGRDFYDNSATAKARIDAAGDHLGIPLAEILFSGPEPELMRTSVCQPALFVHGIVCLEMLRERVPGLEISALAGLSLGEFTAHAGAGSFSFEAGLDLVAKRGRYMADAANSSDGTMAVMNGCSEDEIADLANRFGVEIGNFNTPTQFVISGARESVLKAADTAEQEKLCKTQILKVSGAFHSRLMESAQQKLAADLADLNIDEPDFPVISNVTARPVNQPAEISETLRRQVTEPVRWSDSMRWLADQGESCFIQLGPGKSLAGLMRKNVKGTRVHCIEDCESLDKTVSELFPDV